MISNTSLSILRILLRLDHSLGLTPLSCIYRQQCSVCIRKRCKLRQIFWLVVVIFSTVISWIEAYKSFRLLAHSKLPQTLLTSVFHGFMSVLNFATLINFIMIQTAATEMCKVMNMLFRYSFQRERCKFLFVCLKLHGNFKLTLILL